MTDRHEILNVSILMPFISIALAFAAAHPAPPARLDRLVALARLDAAVHYFDPAVATRASAWDSLFAANVVAITDAPTSAEYARRAHAMMEALHPKPAEVSQASSPQRALVYEGFPTAIMQASGSYRIRWRSASVGETYGVDLGEGVRIDVPVVEPGDTTASVAPQAVPQTAAWRAGGYPDRGYRILGAARLWGTIHYFYPYKALMDGSWDAQLRVALPPIENARTGEEYALAVARFAAHINDAHVYVAHRALSWYAGSVPVGAAAQLIGSSLVITRIADSTASRAGLRVGDEVLSVDGEPVAKRSARLTPIFAASTPQSLRARLEQSLLTGADTTPARLVVRGATGGERSLIVPRSLAFAPRLSKQRVGRIVRLLPGNIGYIDLDRLPVAMVDSAFRMLKDTKAIILDDRGYPLGTAWAIGPRLNIHPEPTPAAKFSRPVVPSPDTARSTRVELDQPIPPAGNTPKYTGRTVLLVDERTISQAEHTGLFFEAANGTTIVGTPTRGANGDVSAFAIPGIESISFTAQEVRHADGRQLQRVGLKPDVVVAPTLAGIRAGRDEVLERAFQLVGGSGPVPVDSVVETYAPVVVRQVPEWNGSGDDFLSGIDMVTFRSGVASGHVAARTSTPSGFGSLSQAMRADDYRGKRIRFSAFVKTRTVGSAVLWMRVDGRGGMLAFDGMLNRALRGSQDWTEVSVVLDVPDDADGIIFGLISRGTGEAWIDDASLSVVGTDVSSTNQMPAAPNPANVDAIRRMFSRQSRAPLNLGFEPR